MGFLYAVGLHVPVSQPKALVHYVMAAVGGNVLAQLALGYRYFAGATVAYSCERSLEYYRAVANNGTYWKCSYFFQYEVLITINKL